MAEPHQGKKNISFQDEPIGDKTGFKGDSGTRRKTKVFDSDKLLKGTTAMAFIGETAIHLASDQRAVCTSGQRGVLLTYVSTDELMKFYNIDNGILASAAGYSERCMQFAQVAIDVNEAAFRGVPAPERVYLAARVVMTCMDNWEMMNPGLTCQEEFIIAGYHYAQALVFRVRSSTLGGIVCGTGVGYSAIIGSGKTHAAEFVEAHINNLQPHTLVESAIVVASVKEKSTGGRVQRAEIPIGGNQETIFWDPPFSVLQLLERDLDRYRYLLENSLFFVCHGFDYTEQNEPMLLQALARRFPGTSNHIISRRNRVIRIITFNDAWSAILAWEDTRDGMALAIGPQNYSLEFLEPSPQHMGILRYEEQK